jgi:hypothetical protein
MLAGTEKLQPVLRRNRQIRQNFGIVRENRRREIAFEMKKKVKKDLRVLPRLREVESVEAGSSRQIPGSSDREYSENAPLEIVFDQKWTRLLVRKKFDEIGFGIRNIERKTAKLTHGNDIGWTRVDQAEIIGGRTSCEFGGPSSAKSKNQNCEARPRVQQESAPGQWRQVMQESNPTANSRHMSYIARKTFKQFRRRDAK